MHCIKRTAQKNHLWLSADRSPAHQQQVRLTDAALLRGTAGKVLHAVRARQAVREGHIQQLGRRGGWNFCQQQREAAGAPRERSEAALQADTKL